jgi:hypothetical protein
VGPWGLVFYEMDFGKMINLEITFGGFTENEFLIK